ncbi:MAG: hypothetical protein K6A14_07725 [Erysipelotrichaceae bacterium]|nr:hypothetical protein [Erysipelotrichaceae bacterium]
MRYPLLHVYAVWESNEPEVPETGDVTMAYAGLSTMIVSWIGMASIVIARRKNEA